MKILGGCYCGELRYEAEGEPIMAFQCHCRECQYYSGGGANYSMAMPAHGFKYTKGQPQSFTRTDINEPPTREFCGTCGTAVTSSYKHQPEVIMLKAGSFDQPSLFTPQIAVFTCDQQDFQIIPEGMPSFEKKPEG